MERVEIRDSSYVCHVFVCVNDREGKSKSCADEGSVELRERLKTAVAERGWRPRVRVTQSGCMGLCGEGPNVMIYPQQIRFRRARPEDASAILAEIERLLEADRDGGAR